MFGARPLQEADVWYPASAASRCVVPGLCCKQMFGARPLLEADVGFGKSRRGRGKVQESSWRSSGDSQFEREQQLKALELAHRGEGYLLETHCTEALSQMVMEARNRTMVTEFILIGLSGGLGIRILIFIVLLLVYIVSMVGNVFMLFMISIDKQLHTPMYFFLWNLSLLETFFISSVVPLMLVQTMSMRTSVSLATCFTQSFFFGYLATNSFYLLPIMSFDRYVAICNPLRYTTILTGQLCLELVIFSWLGSLLCILYPTIGISRLPFCGPNIINHVFCDSFSIVQLACADTGHLQLIDIIMALFFLTCSLGLTLVSYSFIIRTIVRIPSTNGRLKAFSTCSSHLTMVAIVYGSSIFIQVSPAFHPSVEVYKTVNMFSTIMSPLMNPFIYTFRNEKFKAVIMKHLHILKNVHVKL
ncbi:olfactory receptor 6E1-like [Pleurodeles waltl]|uniref:olfactory receptor 6E1-like n=1 Tax=Pleurodeles waltl TaxID=8319 RepID=UPI00370968F8